MPFCINCFKIVEGRLTPDGRGIYCEYCSMIIEQDGETK